MQLGDKAGRSIIELDSFLLSFLSGYTILANFFNLKSH